MSAATKAPSELASILLDELMRHMHERQEPVTPLDRAMTDAWLRGRGYLRFTETGAVEHVPYDEVHKS
jgi:putative SOS response-associated peptidase YedK